MSKKMNTLLASLAAVAAMAIALPAAAAPRASPRSRVRRGSNSRVSTLSPPSRADGRDEQVVVLKGRFTKQLTKEKFGFTDAKGDTIVCELDDDRDWSMIREDALVEIRAEIDKDFMHMKLEVESARPLE